MVADTLDDHRVALLEPLGVAVNAVEKADVHGDTVLVTGCGPIGLMGIAASKAMGASKVVATSRTQAKLNKALEMGADAVFNANDPDCVPQIRDTVGREGVGAVIEMSGAQEAINQGLATIRCAGRFVQVGTPGTPVTLDMVGPGLRIFNRFRSSSVLTCFLVVYSWPGPCMNNHRTLTSLYSC